MTTVSEILTDIEQACGSLVRAAWQHSEQGQPAVGTDAWFSSARRMLSAQRRRAAERAANGGRDFHPTPVGIYGAGSTGGDWLGEDG